MGQRRAPARAGAVIGADAHAMVRSGSSTTGSARLLTIAGHLLIAVSFLLPWIDGALGAASALSGLRLAELAADGAVVDVWGIPLGGAAGMAVLYAWPAFALDGVLGALLGPRLGLGARGTATLSGLFALPTFAIAAGTAAVALWGGLSLVDGPAVGLVVALLASAATLVAAGWWRAAS